MLCWNDFIVARVLKTKPRTMGAGPDGGSVAPGNCYASSWVFTSSARRPGFVNALGGGESSEALVHDV